MITFLKTSPVTHLSEPGLVNQLDDPETQEAIKKWPILTFDPTKEPCPPPLEPDLAWAWPLILLGAALALLVRWLSLRKN